MEGAGRGEEFAEVDDSTFPDQDEIDSLFDSFTDESLQEQIEPVMQPIIDLVRNSVDYDDVERKLYSLFSDIPTRDFEELLAKVIFLGEMHGRATALDDTSPSLEGDAGRGQQ